MPDQNSISTAKTFMLWIVFASLFFSCDYILAQGSQSFSHQAWMSENGLPQNSVHQVLQTRDGFLWIATEGGLARFDGFDFRIFSRQNDPAFPSGDICCLAEDASGTLWAGTSDTLLRFDGARFHALGSQNGLPAGEMIALVPAPDGTLLVLTREALARVSGREITPIRLAIGNVPSAATAAPKGEIWLASGNQIFAYSKGQMRVEHSLSLAPLETVLGIQVQANETLWVRTNRRIMRLAANTQHTWQLGKDLPGNRAESLWVDPSGTAWVGTNRGLVTIGPDGEISSGVDSIGVNSILSVTGDREGDIWVGTETAGLHVLRPQQFHNLPDLSDQEITAVVQAKDGTMWMGTREDGLRRYRSGRIDTPKESGKLASQIVLALAPGTHDDLWVGTPDGLNHIEAGRVSTWNSGNGLPDDFVRSLLLDEDGSLWVGTRRGLAHWKDDHVVATYTGAEGLHSELIGAMLRSRQDSHLADPAAGDLWIATLAGLSRLHNGSISTYTKTDGLAGDVITSLAQDNTGAIWIGARDGGLTRYTGGRFEAFRQQELPQEVESIIPDGLGSLWLASRRGVASVSLASLDICAKNPTCRLALSQYGYSNGLPSEEVSATGHPASWRTTDGELWFATRKGVAIISPDHIHESPVKFPVAIERFVVDEAEQPTSSSESKISPGHASFNIQYVGLDYSAPSRIRYRYRLDGIDKHWIDAGIRRTAYYTNLPPGAYRFRVEAINAEGTWGMNAAELRFRVLPPFYRQPWFYTLCALLVAATIYAVYRLRLRQLNSRFDAVLAERNRIAREIHDTLAQGYVGISLHLELVGQALAAENVSAAGRQIQTAQRLVREGLADARQSIWELRTLAAQDSLPTRLAKVAELATDRSIVAATLDVSGTYRALSPRLEGEILRVAQEAVANATRHADARTLQIGLKYDADQLALTVVDDGRGFSLMEVPAEGHFGLEGMRERAAGIGAKLEVQSAPGAGTRISLTAKI